MEGGWRRAVHRAGFSEIETPDLIRTGVCSSKPSEPPERRMKSSRRCISGLEAGVDDCDSEMGACREGWGLRWESKERVVVKRW